jgi:hypothetical protein
MSRLFLEGSEVASSRQLTDSDRKKTTRPSKYYGIAAAGTRHGVRCEAFDQFDDLKALARRKLTESLQK